MGTQKKLRLYDTREQKIRDFVPLDPNNIGVYVCGPTVQSGPHLGHLRSAVCFDVLHRWLRHRFGRVTFIRNVTDIDDKVLAKASDTEAWWQIAYHAEREFTQAYAAVGVLPPTYEPRATGFIPQIIDLITRLIDSGHAYPADDGSANVYFDVRSWPDYGELTHQALHDMDAQSEGVDRGKKDPHDFALWKAAKSTEPSDATWDSPWGRGRPGWHIECSAMTRRYVGPEFDIHGGGLDLRFPHHENEIAQSRATGDAFARYWMHNGLVVLNGQKMSKSLGNTIASAELLERYSGRVLRYALLSAHYRSTLDISESTVAEANAALDRIHGFIDRFQRDGGADDSAEASLTELPEDFVAVMDDDLSVPQALALIHERVRQGNIALDSGDSNRAAQAYGELCAMLTMLGFSVSPSTELTAGTRAEKTLVTVVDHLIAQRNHAREEKDWATADRIRDTLTIARISVEDSTGKTHWSIDE